MKILFVEPPKDLWFVMGEYLPPPLGILQLAAFLEFKNSDWEVEVVDCQAENVGWSKLRKKIETFNPKVVVTSALATCNTYTVLRTVGMVKEIDPDIVTVVGGQHFTALARESLENYPEIDYIVRGEGEITLWELMRSIEESLVPAKVQGISYQGNRGVVHNPNRPLIENLDDLPFPGYHFIEDNMDRYHFKMMAHTGSGYAMVEASRGCQYKCSFCSQWSFWGKRWRAKSPSRIAAEMERLYNDYGISFLWLTDDNLGLGHRISSLCDEIFKLDVEDDFSWFVQARSDDIIRNHKILPKMRKAGNYWVMSGLEHHNQLTLEGFNKKIKLEDSKKSMELLKEADIFAQATLITGARSDSHQSLEGLREFVNHVDPDLAIFMILTPFPGTPLYDTAYQNGWIEDYNWSNYDMVHAVMPTEHLTRQEVQEELLNCYRSYYGSIRRRVSGIFSKNMFKRKTYRYMAGQGLLQAFKDLI